MGSSAWDRVDKSSCKVNKVKNRDFNAGWANHLDFDSFKNEDGVQSDGDPGAGLERDRSVSR